MSGPKTNERPGTKAVLRHAHLSPYKAREVLDLVRNKPVGEAEDILRFCQRDAAATVAKVVRSAVANAQNNDDADPEELYICAAFADEGPTIKRWRPRARGRATRIRKRTCHITVIVARLPEDQLERLVARRRAEQLAMRARRVAGARRREGQGVNRAERRRRQPAPEAQEASAVSEEPVVSEADAPATPAVSDVAAAEEVEVPGEIPDPIEAEETAQAEELEAGDPGEAAGEAKETASEKGEEESD